MPSVKVGLELPVPVAPPTPAEAPQVAPPGTPTPLALPQLTQMPAIPVPAPATPAIPAPAVPAPVVELPLTQATQRPVMPMVRDFDPEPAPMPRPAQPQTAQAAPAPAFVPAAGFVLDTGAVVSNPAPQTPPVQAAPQPPAPVQVTPSPAAAPMTTSVVAEKKLKVVLHMGDDRPRFVVQDGDETYLRVVCDGVEVKAPSDRGELMSVLKAAGKVRFVTPGGEGTCDELTVVPGTGQVVVSGKVSFQYNWGKLETTVTGERMTFRLGAPAAPGVEPTISTSYRK
jgi:hypothetical protein